MSRPIRIDDRAQSDADTIFNWLARRSVRGAISWYLVFHQTVKAIAASPETYAEAPESQSVGRIVRNALFKTRRGRVYRVIFESTITEVVILRVRGPGQALVSRRNLPRA